MRTIIFGSRGFSARDYAALLLAIERSGFAVTSVVGGKARGADDLGERYAEENDLPFVPMPARWRHRPPPGMDYDPQAGHDRNEEMAICASLAPEGGAAIGLWDGRSRGTKDMERRARRHGLAVHVETVAPRPMPKLGKFKVGTSRRR